MRTVLGVGGGETKEKGETVPEMSISCLVGLIDLMGEKNIDTDTDVPIAASLLAKEVKRTLSRASSAFTNEQEDKGQSIEEMIWEIGPGQPLTKTERERVQGVYIAFRRIPDEKGKVFASGLRIWRDDISGHTKWENDHPVTTGASLQYRGHVRSHENSHLSLAALRHDRQYLNIISVRVPTVRLGHLHGIAFLDTDDVPTVARVFLREVEGASSISDISHRLGVVSIEAALSLGLKFENDIDISPYTDEAEVYLDNKRAVKTKKYSGVY
ncbi:MAG: hypothetical protein AAF311_05850 [Pseudomonadota bacterium]